MKRDTQSGKFRFIIYKGFFKRGSLFILSMDVWNPGKNRWRYKEGSDEKIIEIELTQGKVAQIDAHRLEEVQKYRWVAKKDGRTYYAITRIKIANNKLQIIAMHIMLFFDIIPPRDHIDRNGLNNTYVNVRSGANGINRRNSQGKRQNPGVLDQPNFNRYRVVWKEADGKTKEKYFSWSKYPTKETAYESAVLCRKTNAERVIDELEKINMNYKKQRIDD